MIGHVDVYYIKIFICGRQLALAILNLLIAIMRAWHVCSSLCNLLYSVPDKTECTTSGVLESSDMLIKLLIDCLDFH